MSGTSLTTVLEERPLYVTLALQKRPVDNSHRSHGVGARAESPSAQVSSAFFAELMDVGDFEQVSQSSLDSSLGSQPPSPLDSQFAASLPDGGAILSEIPSFPIVSSAVSPRRNMLSNKVQDSLASTRIVVGLFSPSSDDLTMLEMLKEKLSSFGGSCQASDVGQSNNDDFFEINGGHRVLTTFRAILGEQPFKELVSATASRERAPLKGQNVDIDDVEKHRVDIDSALNMILGIPKDVATRDDVQAKLKPMWTRVCEHAELKLDGTPRKKKERQKLDENVHCDSSPGPPSQKRRMSSRLIAVAAQSAVNHHDRIRKVHDEDSSRGLRRSKRNRGLDDEVSPKDVVEYHGPKEKEREEEDQEASEGLREHQSRHVVEVPIVNDQHNKELKEVDYVDDVEEKSHVDEKKREREEKDDDPEMAQARVLLTLMEEDAKSNVDLLESLTKDNKNYGSKEVKMSIPVEDLTPPSAVVEAERAERLLFEDGMSRNVCLEELRSCLSVDPLDESSTSIGLIRSQQHQKPIERIGVLMRWWRIVRRSFTFAGLWYALEKKRSRTKKKCRKSLKDMYRAQMEEIKNHSNSSTEGEGQVGGVRVYGYDQAVKYVQLGDFLIQHPQFVMQTHRSRLSDWLKPLKVSLPPCSDSLEKDVGQKRRPFIDVIKELLLQSSIDDSSLKRKDFENNKSSVKKRRTNARGKEACSCCSKDNHEGEDDDMVKCTECDCLFHEDCAGYEKGMCLSSLSTVGNKLGFFDGSVYCPDCLDEKQLTVIDVKDSLREQHGLAEYLNGEDCPYVFKHVDRDGFCLFRNLVEFVREESLLMTLGEGDTTDAVLCGKIIDESLKMTEALRVDLGDDAVDSDALKALMDVQQDVKGIVHAIKSRWLDLDAEQIIRGFVQMFQGRVAVKVFRLSPNHPQVTEQVYPEERNGAECVICMFHWHSLLHFDRLIPKHQTNK